MATDVTVATPIGLGSASQMSNGFFTSDGNATSCTVGFTPRKVTVYNLTDNIVWEWSQGFPATNTMKSVAAAQSVDTTNAISVGLDAGLQEPASSFLINAAACGTGKTIVWRAEG